MIPRHRILPAAGTVMASTDVHGNLEDFARLETLFRAAAPDTHWVILGDVVHAPDAQARAAEPDLYDYDDGSMAIVARIDALVRAEPERVHFVLGNHDHGHVGGPHPRKFHGDEVAALEAKLDAGERALLVELFGRALLAVAAPCGVLFTHGSPDAFLTSLAMLDDLPLDVRAMPLEAKRAVRGILTAYGQPDDVSRRMLASISRPGLDLRVVVHGHDRDESGFFHEGETQVCPVIFGAPKASKRYVRLDLAARYPRGQALRDGVEIVRLHA